MGQHKKLKIGVIGAGHLGKIHLKLLRDISQFDITGFYDINPHVATQVAAELGLISFHTPEDLLTHSEVVDIVTPTATHFEYAAAAIRRGKHVFIEKPLAATEKEARTLLQLAREASVKVQVGHVERFNPALLAIHHSGIELNPLFVEAHRLTQFHSRGTDVSVVLDLMIHDIDIVLSVVKSTIKKISASGVAVVSRNPDIANARIEFSNGCVANLTASRISMKQMRKIRFFQKDTYLSIDLALKKADIFVRKYPPLTDDSDVLAIGDPSSEAEKLYVQYLSPIPPDINAIKYELELFARSIIHDTEPAVTLLDGYNALHVAHQIIRKIERTSFK